jgi:hypothetical protein
MVAPIGKVQCILTGFAGAPGLINLYWNGAAAGSFTSADATAAVAATYALMNAIKGGFTSSCAIQVQPNVETVDALTGQLIGVVSATPVASITGTGTGTTLAAEGPLLQWLTADVVGRRLVRGRTFIVPSASAALSTIGTVLPTYVTTALAAAAAYIATSGPSPVIWHRPVPFSTGANGSAHEIVAAGMPLTVAVLRSRRD